MPKKQLAVVACIAVVLVACGAFLFLVSPFGEQNVRERLQKRFGQGVTIGKFSRTWMPPGCDLRDVRIGDSITAKRAIFHATYASLLLPPRGITEIDVTGLHVIYRPGRKFQSNGGNANTSVPVIHIRQAWLDAFSSESDLTPLRFEIHSLDIAHSQFNVAFTNSKPPGEIVASGKFGKYEANRPSAFPVAGTYTFSNANLGVFHGISGTLYSKGTFEGPLNSVRAAGTADVIQFHVQGASSPVDLHSTFQGLVNGTTGDTTLTAVEARAGHSILHAAGEVKHKTARLQIKMTEGRVDDLLRYFSTQKKPSMSGSAWLQADVVVPPGEGFLKKLRLIGDWGVDHAHFTDPARQEAFDHLSESAQGEKKDRQEEDSRTMPIRIVAHTEVSQGNASITRAQLTMTGVAAQVNGTFNLLNKAVDMHGVVETNGKLADSAHGFKSLALQVISPFFKRHHDTVLPFTIRGTSSNLKLGLDLSAKRQTASSR